MNPQDNAFLLAPLAKKAGGTQKCERIVFALTDDVDYQRILETFLPVQERVTQLPRADMPNFIEPPCPTHILSTNAEEKLFLTHFTTENILCHIQNHKICTDAGFRGETFWPVAPGVSEQPVPFRRNFSFQKGFLPKTLRPRSK